MSAAIKFDEGRGGAMSGDGEGGMNDVLKRLGAVETSVVETRIQVASIAAIIPTVATQATVESIAATIPHLAAKADLNELKSEVGHMETRIIKWMIATVLTTAGLAFSIAKFVH
jgi:hypothetical protein